MKKRNLCFPLLAIDVGTIVFLLNIMINKVYNDSQMIAVLICLGAFVLVAMVIVAIFNHCIIDDYIGERVIKNFIMLIVGVLGAFVGSFFVDFSAKYFFNFAFGVYFCLFAPLMIVSMFIPNVLRLINSKRNDK